MFTGIISAVGRVGGGDGARQFFSCPNGWLTGVTLGGSIAVSGVCLTAVAFGSGNDNGRGEGNGENNGRGEGFFADLSEETRNRCAGFTAGDLVNLEKPLTVGAPLGGHFVAGHVDGVGEVLEVDNQAAGGFVLSIRPPLELLPLIAEKGSVTVAGVSLTVAGFDEGFLVSIVPHTAEQTNLKDVRVGQRVNIEVDLLARHIARLLEFEK